ncbi:MAG: dTDP-4-dehydrorhamnose 3,5-epimerase family protein [Chloroflexi bacterium]|nr:dTDP-4-dehydrorhamnose 3,5-epimerase family protein [Chloroflexota bacterium]
MSVEQTPARPLDTIAGVYMMPLKSFGDARGRFTETFRGEWFPWIRWDRLQMNRSDSAAGVLRGLHYHHKQIDYWYLQSGQIRVGMADLRRSSPTYMATVTLEMGTENAFGLFIPSGVAHGFVALTECTLTYLVNNYYDGSDELGVAWNDPQLGIGWGVEAPVVSARDAQNRLLRAIPAEELPR